MLCSDTPFLIEKHVSRTGIRCGGYDSHSDTPFREKKPVSRARGRRKRLMRCSDTPFREQKPVSRARRGRKRRTEATPHCTTRYDHLTKPQHIIPHHTTSYHIISQPYPNPTTLPTDKPHTIPQTPYTTPLYNKKLLPQNRRKSFIDLSANRLSQ